MLQTCPVVSVMPLLSVMSAGNCTPGLLPWLMVSGLAVIVTVRLRPSKLSAQEAFVPQRMSAVGCGGPLAGGLDCEAWAPQTLSTARMRALAVTVIALLNPTGSSSPVSSVPLEQP